MEISPTSNAKHDSTVNPAKRPKVLIVGAGLAGLTLAMLLHKANIPYEVFERAQESKPLGSGTVLTSQTWPLIRQLGLEEEFNSLSKVLTTINVGKENRQIDFQITVGSKGAMERFGGETRLITRPVLYDLFLRQIPKERVHFGKKILTTKQGGNGVLIRCSDGTEYEGDILAGADGAHSAVRQNLYAELKEQNKLPPLDGEALPFINVCLVGQTRPLTVEEFADIELEECQFNRVVGENKPYAWGTFTTAQRTVAYSLVEFLPMETSKNDETFCDSEWGPEATAVMCEQVRDFPIIAGGDKKFTVGDLIDWTPKEYISKVMLEEKVFQTWSSCRTVLLGDACHKFNPSGGAGATNAMHDAVILANYIDALPDHPTTDDIEKAFLSYKGDRIEWVEDVFEQSKLFRSMVDKGIKATIIRFILKYAPAAVMKSRNERQASYKSQAAFLPPDKADPLVKAIYQPSLHAKAQAHERVAQEKKS
ncbi:hypothetical protein KI688_005743 [Linnemannia hyalina]|uniref:FAD-binding domain-containing protein n=1 Tax=Linnemannia hyalina TaxID=64524 RepID=A0A9P8BXS0_9FUNG|nr:hypothetical protein KI688_005743 [Linnemannia hyalina]